MAQQLWSTHSGYMATTTLSEALRTALQPLTRFRQFCDVEEALGYNVGQTYQWNVYGDTSDEASITGIDENQRMPETGFAVGYSTLTITEFGMSVPYSGKFDMLSEHPVKKIIHKQLLNNANRCLDGAAHAEFDSTILRAMGGASGAITLDDDGTPTGTNNTNLTIDHVKTIADTMAERNIPTFDGENYVCIARPTTLRPLREEIEAIAQYTTDGWNRLVNGEIGRYEGIRFVTQTNIASESWSSAKSDAAYFFGADTVLEAVVVPEEIRGKIPDDYGRGKGIAWYYVGGFGIIHADQTSTETKKQARIIKWDSAA